MAKRSKPASRVIKKLALEDIALEGGLIAAAPDLLAACERALDLLGVIEEQHSCGDARTTAILRAAIAKARGE